MSAFGKKTFKGMTKEQCFIAGIFEGSDMFQDVFTKLDTDWSRTAAEFIENYTGEENIPETSEKTVDEGSESA